MARTIKVMLGEVEYEVPRLNLGEVEEYVELLLAERPKIELKFGIQIAEIAFRRAKPDIPDIRKIECSPKQLADATDEVFLFCGLITKAPAPGEVKAESAT